MNFIDISSWQSGIDLPALFAQNPLDGVVVKSTGGVSYVNPDCTGWVQWLIENGKPFGFYHFLNDDGQNSSGSMEARFFVANTRDYFGKGIPFIDYEGTAVQRGTAYLKECLDTVFCLTGIKPGVYCSQSVTQAQDFSAIAQAGYPLWMAQYASMDTVYGFTDDPWHSGSVAPFNGYIMQQYTSCGRLEGYDGNLDLDKCLISYAEWTERARGESAEAPVEKKPTGLSVVLDVLHGKYGIGAERVTSLSEAGYDAEAVQKKVNELYAVAMSCKRYIGDDNMPYLPAIDWIIKCF